MKKIYTLLAVLFLWPVFSYSQNAETCDVAVVITTDGTYTTETLTGTGAEGAGATAAAWWSYTPSTDGTINVSSCGAALDTRLYIYSGDCGALVSVDNDDDGCLAPTSLASVILDLPVVSGTTYYIEWNDRWTATGFDWTFSFVPPPTCPDLTGLGVSEVTGTDATFNWNPDGTAYEYAVGPSGFDITSATYTATVDTFATVAGLDAETDYEAYVRVTCGADLGAWSMVSFTTPCGPDAVQSIPYFEDFESVVTPNLPCGGWIITNNEAGTNTWVSYSGQDLAITYNTTAPDDDLAQTPELGLTGGVSYTLSFDLRGQSTSYVESMAVVLYDGLVAIDTLLNFPAINYSVFQLKTVDFTPATDGNYRIGFYAYSIPDQWRIHVDNIQVIVTPDCPSPLVLNIMDITDVSASAHWSNVGADYEVAYDVTGFDISLATPVAVTDTMYAMSGLTALTDYDVYVRQNCTSDGVYSDWNMTTFSTNGTPPANDLICDATVVALGDTTVVDNTWATWGGDSATCWGNYNNGDVWLEFTFTPTAEFNGVEIVTEAGSSDDSHIALYSSDSDCSGTLTQLGCSEDIGGGNWMSYVGPTMLEAGTYYVQGAAWTNAEGTYGIAIHPVLVPNPPANDNCEGAPNTAVVVDGATASNTGDATGATDEFGFGLNNVWESFTIDECANITIDFCGSAQTSTALFNVLYDACPQGASVQTATILAVPDCGDGNGSISANWVQIPAGTYYYPVIADVATYGGYDAYTINFTATSCEPASDTCTTFLGGPWTDFNSTFGGAPVAVDGVCPLNEISTFQVWASEAYTVDGFVNGETYTFSMCNGYGAWAAELSVWDDNGEIIAFLSDTCSISWTATYDGTYVIGINEVGACGPASTNTSTDNGFPSLTCEGANSVEDITLANFTVYPNPNNGQFSIVNEGVNGNYIIELIDVTGRVVYSEQVQMNSNARTEINSTDVNTGVYLVKMTNTDENYYRTLRMIIK